MWVFSLSLRDFKIKLEYGGDVIEICTELFSIYLFIFLQSSWNNSTFEDSNILYSNELDNGVIVGIKQEISEGAFPISPGAVVTLDYTGWLSNGCIFDSSYLPGVNTLTFKTGTGLAIPGFESGILNLGEGSIARIAIPPEMGYGAIGVRGLIPPNETIYFEVKIIKVEVDTID